VQIDSVVDRKLTYALCITVYMSKIADVTVRNHEIAHDICDMQNLYLSNKLFTKIEIGDRNNINHFVIIVLYNRKVGFLSSARISP
jgi:hypothetical protein